MLITYDEAKRVKTLEERGLDFKDAEKVFEGITITGPDNRKDYGEDRYITFGYLDGRPVILVWTDRDGGCRIISMRNANDRERAHYQRTLD